ncbi:MMPL family transporter [Paraconexibacter antarcticus]|uniref:MMPL family transporter n=1 Tax=Paraconexibacter antarcticus TaxID=2949664 RepID=A0ABY5E0Y7_9ACTN|nr:MMPL family transporter [Paraconexibacter antarcticus]UTI63245.1 MMPL family transporter [Paraconexibacter antarcticus]UTI66757.1 MMPL family transporter [Paraconexibacter antarcticus]
MPTSATKDPSAAAASALGPLGRLAYASATHARRTAVVWFVVVAGLGAFLPQLEHSLAGSGMWATGSDSVKARDVVQTADPLASSSALSVVMHGARPYAEDPAFRRAARAESRLLGGDKAVRGTVGPQKAGLISADGRTVIVTAGAGASPKEMIRAADRLRGQVPKVAGPRYRAYLSGLSAQWADFNKDNRDATLHSETYALPITLLVLALAFGSLMAGGLPLLITVIGLAVTGGTLTILTHLFDISLWALTFTLIFTMALGIDYALFIVMRFREALREHADPALAAAVTMDTAGRAIAFSGTTVFLAIGVCFLIPSPMPRAISLAIMLSVTLVLTVMFTLMPMLMARLGPRIDAGATPWRRRQNQRGARADGDGLMTRWGAFVWRHPRPLAAAAILVLVVLALPLGHLRIGIPGDAILPDDAPARQGAQLVNHAFGVSGIAPVTVAAPAGDGARAEAVMRADRDLVGVRPLPTTPGTDHVLLQAALRVAPDSRAAGTQIDRLRAELPPDALVGHAPAELHDLQRAMTNKAPLVLGMILVLGSILLLIAVQAPLIALAGTLTSVLSTAAALGITVHVFQDGHLTGLLGFQSQGFIDFWVPVFFSAMIFAIAMDYTVFFISSARERWDETRDARTAVVHGMGRSGPVIVAAVAAMLGVFGSFAFSPAVPAKEMGVVLGVAVLLDAFLVRLLLLPALISIAGPRAWHQPHWLGRLLPKFSLSHRQPGAVAPGTQKPNQPEVAVHA